MARAEASSQAPATRLYRVGGAGERWFFALLLVPALLTALLVYTRGETIESELRTKTMTAVEAAGVHGVQVEMSGRKATLLVPTGQDQKLAVTAARTVEGIGSVDAEHVARTAAEAAACDDLQAKIDATTRGRGVPFSGSSVAMTGPGAAAARSIAKLLVRCPTAKVVAGGHVDATVLDGGGVSLKRANAVRQALVRGGVDASRIDVQGYDDTFPLSPSDQALNNRVMVTLAGE